MMILDGMEKRIGILGAATVSAVMLLSGCAGPTIMENREGVPSAVRELGYQKDTAIPAAAPTVATVDKDLELEEAALLAQGDNSQQVDAAVNVPADSAGVENYPRMEDMSKKTVGPKVEKPTTKIVASGEYYVVARGDSLGSIAKKFKVKRADLIAVNNISNPNMIRIGQKLKLPKNAQLSGRGAVNTVNNSGASAAVVNGLYTVKPNDSISKIAKNLKITRASLMQANNLNENSILRIGQKLVVPNATSTAVVEPIKVEETAPVNTDKAVDDKDFKALTDMINEVDSAAADKAKDAGEAAKDTAAEVVKEPEKTTPAATPAVQEEIPSVFTLETDCSVKDLCAKFNLNEQDFRLFNSLSIGEDDIIKAGKTVFLK